jgi:hypothetical protein
MTLAVAAAAAALAAGSAHAQSAPASNMSFFVTSTNPGKGGDLGGLEGADRHCRSLAQAAGAGSKTWRAYLSTQPAGSTTAVNAKDRIGTGPWINAKGVQIAANVADLHGDNNKINKESALDEKGNIIKGRGDTPNQHDILTGSQRDGTAYAAGDDKTCRNWTSSTDGSAFVGHTDLIGNPQGINFWNFSHGTPGCGTESLARVGGAGFFYCFATN